MRNLRLFYSAWERKPKYATLVPTLKILLENTNLKHDLLLSYKEFNGVEGLNIKKRPLIVSNSFSLDVDLFVIPTPNN